MKIIRTEDVAGTHREVKGPGWTSRRLLVRRDGMGFSLHEIIVPPGAEMKLWYKNHLEAVFCVSGSGSIHDLATGETHDLRDGTLYALDAHDRHVLRGGAEEMRLVCVYNPPVAGDERHDEEGSYEVEKRNVFIIGLDDFNLQTRLR